jgi:hypothetical protein
MKLRNCLDTPGVYNIWHAYTPDICYRIAWAIIDDGRSFFSTTMIQQDFLQPGAFFPESLIESILPEVRYANQIQRANYPTEWQSRQPIRAMAQSGAGNAATWTPPAPASTQNTAAQSKPKTTTNNTWVDNRHPAIVGLMAPYIAKLGDNVFVGELLDAAGK